MPSQPITFSGEKRERVSLVSACLACEVADEKEEGGGSKVWPLTCVGGRGGSIFEVQDDRLVMVLANDVRTDTFLKLHHAIWYEFDQLVEKVRAMTAVETRLAGMKSEQLLLAHVVWIVALGMIAIYVGVIGEFVFGGDGLHGGEDVGVRPLHACLRVGGEGESGADLAKAAGLLVELDRNAAL